MTKAQIKLTWFADGFPKYESRAECEVVYGPKQEDLCAAMLALLDETVTQMILHARPKDYDGINSKGIDLSITNGTQVASLDIVHRVEDDAQQTGDAIVKWLLGESVRRVIA